jgi:hypothetical protein
MSAGTAGREWATIQNVDSSGSPEIKCMFNPKEYTFSKSNSWTLGPVKGANLPKLEFSSGQPATLQMQLFFDTWGSGGAGGDPIDVRTHTDPLWDLMLVDPKLKNKAKLGRPPIVQFRWGKAWSFQAVITQITMRFTMFDRIGVPVRATLDVTFQQHNDPKGFGRQNPTSGGREGGRLWRVTEGDTLAGIAWTEYGDPTLWRRIADANALTDVRRLRAGTLLEIPNG